MLSYEIIAEAVRRNFGVIFEAVINMKSFFLLSVVLLLIENVTYGQDNAISEFDLHGCWTMERVTRENGPIKGTFVPCDLTDGKSALRNTSIAFYASNKCVFPAVIQSAICPAIYRNVEGTWTYDKESGIVEVYYPKDFKKEVWDAVKEEHPELEIPNPRMKTKFKIVGLENGKLEIEKTTPNKWHN